MDKFQKGVTARGRSFCTQNECILVERKHCTGIHSIPTITAKGDMHAGTAGRGGEVGCIGDVAVDRDGAGVLRAAVAPIAELIAAVGVGREGHRATCRIGAAAGHIAIAAVVGGGADRVVLLRTAAVVTARAVGIVIMPNSTVAGSLSGRVFVRIGIAVRYGRFRIAEGLISNVIS